MLRHCAECGIPILTATGSTLYRGASHLRTWAYCAPEQWRGEPCCERTDVFGTAGVLLYLLSGQAPFDSSIEPRREACRANCLNEAGSQIEQHALSRP